APRPWGLREGALPLWPASPPQTAGHGPASARASPRSTQEESYPPAGRGALLPGAVHPGQQLQALGGLVALVILAQARGDGTRASRSCPSAGAIWLRDRRSVFARITLVNCITRCCSAISGGVLGKSAPSPALPCDPWTRSRRTGMLLAAPSVAAHH